MVLDFYSKTQKDIMNENEIIEADMSDLIATHMAAVTKAVILDFTHLGFTHYELCNDPRFNQPEKNIWITLGNIGLKITQAGSICPSLVVSAAEDMFDYLGWAEPSPSDMDNMCALIGSVTKLIENFVTIEDFKNHWHAVYLRGRSGVIFCEAPKNSGSITFGT